MAWKKKKKIRLKIAVCEWEAYIWYNIQCLLSNKVDTDYETRGQNLWVESNTTMATVP